MTATNHALTGAVIGLAVGNPWVAIPAALASHFVIDFIPHFGMQHAEAQWLRSKKFHYLLAAEAIICISIVVFLYFNDRPHWLLAAVCAFVATTPDLFWIERLKAALDRQALAKSYKNPLQQLHQKIQWFQKPIGLVVELAWAILCIVLLGSLVATR